MQRALNNIERANLKQLKDKGYTTEVKETISWDKQPHYYADVVELKV